MLIHEYDSSEITITTITPGCEVALIGRLDVHTVADVRARFVELTQSGIGDLRVHLAHAEVADATGLGLIVGIHHRALRASRRLVIIDTSPRLERLLRASGLHRILARADADPLLPAAAHLVATGVLPTSLATS